MSTRATLSAPLAGEAGLSSEPPAIKPLTLQHGPIETFQGADELPPVPEMPSGLQHDLQDLSVEQDRVVKVGGVGAHLQGPKQTQGLKRPRPPASQPRALSEGVALYHPNSVTRFPSVPQRRQHPLRRAWAVTPGYRNLSFPSLGLVPRIDHMIHQAGNSSLGHRQVGTWFS